MSNRIKIDFRMGFNGTCRNESGSELKISSDEWKPYELLFSALASCMYATFLDVIEKKRLAYESVTITVDGEKRDEVPAFLKTADIVFTVSGAEKENEKITSKFKKSLQLAEKYCSVFNTLTKVAELNTAIVFQ